MSIRALEASVEVSAFGVGITTVISPFNWRRPLFAYGRSCWSKGSHFHWFIGPLHIYSRPYRLYTMNVGVKFERNGFWWDKPAKRSSDRPGSTEGGV